MSHTWLKVLLIVPLLSVVGMNARAQSLVDAGEALQVSQKAIGNRIGDYVLRNIGGEAIDLRQFRGRPLIVNLIYTACNHTCPLIVQTLADAVGDARGALGSGSFSVITIGFDTANDNAVRMQSFARMQGIDMPDWYFLAIDGEQMRRLADDLGFVYFSSPRGFDHLAQVSVLDQEGRVYRQVYGEDFDSPFLVEPLKDLVFGRAANFVSVEGLINRLRLFCTVYDPSAGRYRFNYASFIGFGIGLFALAGVGTVVASNWLRLFHDKRGRAS